MFHVLNCYLPVRAITDNLVRFLDLLARDPFQRGEYEERGVSGRIYQIKSCRPFTVTYWTDHAAKEVRVVAIRKF